MRSFFQKKENLIFIFILIAGAILRFYNYAEFSLSNDELSALNRVRYDSLSELLNIGVAQLDNHPAGVQVFIYYWTSIFGNSEAALRFPFVITGILSIFFVYLITKRWFGSTSGLFASVGIAFLEFPLLYSQIARPYSFGLFFTLVFAWFWTRLLFDKKQHSIPILSGFILSGALAFYTHYFAGLTVIITGITGLFFLNRKPWLPYLLSGAGIVILFIPHFNIFFRQISKGGLGWVSEPTPSFITDFIFDSLNNSLLVLGALVFVLAGSFFIRKKIPFSKFQLISLLWFVLPFAIGYFYSVFNKPVLRDAVLLFSFPYLLFFLFSAFKGVSLNRNSLILLTLFSTITLYSTTVEKSFYQTYHFGDFKGVAEKSRELEKEFGSDNLAKFTNIVHPYYINHYLQGQGSGFLQYNIDEDTDINEMMDHLNSSEKKYCMFAYINIYNPPEIIELIRRKFPVKVKHIKLRNMSGIQVFKKGGKRKDLVFSSMNTFEQKFGSWDKDMRDFTSKRSFKGEKSQYLTKEKAYSSTFHKPVKEVFKKRGRYITVSVQCYFPEKVDRGNLVVSFERNGEYLEWFGTAIHPFVDSNNTWEEVFTCHPIPENINPDDEVFVYIWNNGEEAFYVDQIEIKVYSDKHYLDN